MKLNKKGFTVIEGLLIVIAITLVVGVGYYVINATRNSAKSNGSANISGQAQKSTDDKTTLEKAKSAEYIEIKELGIKIKKTSELSSFSFANDPSGGGAVLVNESKITQLVNACNANSSNFSVLGLYKNDGQYKEGEGSFLEEPIKEFDTFYISGGRADGGIVCDTDEKSAQLDDALLKTSNLILEAIKNSEKL